MKKILVLILCCLVITGQSVLAETLTIDLDNTSIDELTDAINTLAAVRLQLVTERFKNEHTAQSSGNISFRGIPWVETRENVDKIMNQTKYANKGFIYNTEGRVYTNGIGLYDEYRGLTLVGYDVTQCRLFYVYPTVEDVLIRDDNIALFYYADYYVANLGDISAAQNDITDKLTKLYGNYTNDKNGDRRWTDDQGNTIILHTWENTFDLTYYYAKSETLLHAADHAVDLENAEKEEQNRAENQDNYDGL